MNNDLFWNDHARELLKVLGSDAAAILGKPLPVIRAELIARNHRLHLHDDQTLSGIVATARTGLESNASS